MHVGELMKIWNPSDGWNLMIVCHGSFSFENFNIIIGLQKEKQRQKNEIKVRKSNILKMKESINIWPVAAGHFEIIDVW